MSKKLLKSSLIVASMTLISRVLGLVRDVVVAHLLGAGSAADVFYFANKIPNFLRRLFAEGAFSQAFVPVLTEYTVQNDRAQLKKFIANVSGTLMAIISIVTCLGVLGSAGITAIFGMGFFVEWLHDGPEAYKFELASLLLKITFPYLWFITLVSFASAILNTLGKFAVSSFTPVFLNISLILFATLLAPHLSQPEFALAIAVFCGGCVQLCFQLPFLKKVGLLVKPKWGWSDPGVVKIRKLMIPALFGVSVSQINLLLDTLIASFLATGSISWLYYSDRLLEFPLGLFGIAIATVALPALSQRHSENNPEQFKHTMDWAIRMVLFLGLPAMWGLMVLAKPMLMVLFMRGAFNFDDVSKASLSLIAYACGLLNFMLIKVLAPGYYARQDTKTPVRYGIIAMVANMCFNLVLAPFLGYIGLALATALSALINLFLLYYGLHRQHIYRLSSQTVRFSVQIFIASALMTTAIIQLTPPMADWISWGEFQRVIKLFELILLAATSYFFSAVLLGVRPRHFVNPQHG